MVRLFAAFMGLAIAVPLIAAPVPAHLFPKNPPLYYPTQKGAKWVYLEGKIEHHFVVTEASKSTSGDTTVVSIAEVTNEKQRPYRKMEVSRRGLLWVETTEGAAFDKPIPMLRYPVLTNEKWAFETSGPGGIGTGKGTMKVVGIEEVKVPAGTFSAARVEEEFSLCGSTTMFHTTFWFAPDVGMVKADYDGVTLVLKSFTRP